MILTLFDDHKRSEFLPLVYTRPIADLRFGILRIAEKWALYAERKVQYLTESYLDKVFNPKPEPSDLFINARVLPGKSLTEAIQSLPVEVCLVKDGTVIAARTKEPVSASPLAAFSSYQQIEFGGKVVILEHLTDLYNKNSDAIAEDFHLITSQRKSAIPDASTRVIGPPELLFLEPGAKVFASVINTTTGPVYIGRNAEVMEGSLIRGPFALGDDSTLKMGAKMYGPVSIGPHCKIGGEVSSSAILGFSNKAHDGFLGHSVLGEWCNLGADTNNSNLKNNYSSVKIWNYARKKMEDTGLIFCGLIMGDHSRCGINTMFNTGTVVGVNANIFGGDFVPKHVASFTWGGNEEYQPSKAFETIKKVMARRNIQLTDEMVQLLTEVYNITAPDRLST